MSRGLIPGKVVALVLLLAILACAVMVATGIFAAARVCDRDDPATTSAAAPWRRSVGSDAAGERVVAVVAGREVGAVVATLRSVDPQGMSMEQRWLVLDQDSDGDGFLDALLDTAVLVPPSGVRATIYDRALYAPDAVYTQSVLSNGTEHNPQVTP